MTSVLPKYKTSMQSGQEFTLERYPRNRGKGLLMFLMIVVLVFEEESCADLMVVMCAVEEELSDDE